METLPRAIEIPSRRYGKYVLHSKLGHGGMSEVFVADAVDEHGEVLSVAVKLLKKGTSDDAFANEADLMGLLSHPNLVKLFEVGVAYGRPFIAMEFCVGGDLQAVMEAHRQQMKGFPLALGVHITLEVLKALAYFHQAKTRTGTALNLIHSDVNPANVFFTSHGEVKLGDLGVASSSQLSLGPAEGVTAGKLWYLSPEQTRGEKLTPASDLFAVGIMLHELVVGYHPFHKAGASDGEAMAAIRAGRLSIPDYVAKPLAAVVQKALAADPRNRYRTAGEFAGQLLAYALDSDLHPSREQVQEWLETTVGLIT